MEELFALLEAYATIRRIAEEYTRPVKCDWMHSHLNKLERLEREYIETLDRFHMADMPCTLVLYVQYGCNCHSCRMSDNYL